MMEQKAMYLNKYMTTKPTYSVLEDHDTFMGTENAFILISPKVRRKK